MRKAKAFTLGGLMAVGMILSTTSVALSDTSEHYLTTAPVFAGIPWGTNADAVQTQMIDKGYKLDVDKSAKDTDHDVWFRGLVQNTDSHVIEIFDQNRHLVGTTVWILTPDEDCRSTYDTVVSGIMQKYGNPSSRTERFDPPFTGAPADFIPAIKQDKATFDVALKQAGNNPPGIEARIDDDLTVVIFYNSQQWWAETRRRNSRPDPNL